VVSRDYDAASIKTTYESNADTNAFTDTNQTKLSQIEALADVTDAGNVANAMAGITLSGNIDVNDNNLTNANLISTQQLVIPSGNQSFYNIKFEGVEDDDDKYTTLAVVEPDAAHAILLPNASGTIALLSDLPGTGATGPTGLTAGFITSTYNSSHAAGDPGTGQ